MFDSLKKLLPSRHDSGKGSPLRSLPPPPPRPRSPVVYSLDDMSIMARAIATSGMFGVKNESEALSLMLLCQAEGLHPALAVRRYHIIQGKPSMRADALQGEFEQSGLILWHERNDQECAATFFRNKAMVNIAAMDRARDRYHLLNRGLPVSHLASIGEITIVRTLEDAMEKKVAMSWKDGRWNVKDNWKQSPRQMLHARTLSEGVRAINPGIIAGIYVEDEGFDIPQDEGALMTPEDRVRTATSNREYDASRADDGIIIGAIGTQTLEAITDSNFGEIVCHIGKAEGNMLGKKVSEIPVPVLAWLKNHFGEGEGTRWGNPPDVKDQRLMDAVTLALDKL